MSGWDRSLGSGSRPLYHERRTLSRGSVSVLSMRSPCMEEQGERGEEREREREGERGVLQLAGKMIGKVIQSGPKGGRNKARQIDEPETLLPKQDRRPATQP